MLFYAGIIGVSLAIFCFIGFSLKKHYRYATQLMDLLRYFPILSLLSGIVFSLAVYITQPINLTLILTPMAGALSIVLVYYSVTWISDYSMKQYRDFLESAKLGKFSIHSFEEYADGQIDQEKANLFIRHDVDISLSRTLKMAAIEKELGVSSTYFFRMHAERYTFEQAIPIIKKLSDEGFEIGLHYETLSIAKGDKDKALEIFEKEIQRLREIAPISVVAAHGQKGYKNRDIWETVDKAALKISSAYDMKWDMYLSDAGGKRLRNKDKKHLLERIHEANPGQIIQILIHPDWWF
ncbi:MAG: hypothetical protein ACTSSD_18095 [Candidatus Thorarchaeota archaeon]